MKKKDCYLGFTLLEALVVLIIVSVLAVSSIFASRFILTTNRLKSAADSFSQQTRLARSEAIQSQQDVYLNVQTGSSWCYGINKISTCSCSPSNTCALAVVTSSNYAGITVSSTGFTSNNLAFDSIRGLPAGASSVSFQIGSQSITVNISSLGQVSLCSTNVTGYPAC